MATGAGFGDITAHSPAELFLVILMIVIFTFVNCELQAQVLGAVYAQILRQVSLCRQCLTAWSDVGDFWIFFYLFLTRVGVVCLSVCCCLLLSVGIPTFFMFHDWITSKRFIGLEFGLVAYYGDLLCILLKK